jgi:hypothetical protein
MNERPWMAYSFAVLHVVAHPHLGICVPVGVLVHARTAGFLGIRVVADAPELAERVGEIDVDLLSRYLQTFSAICNGDPAGGPVALLPPSERFHWLTAPRSDVLQCGRVHGGLCHDPAATLADLFDAHVARQA